MFCNVPIERVISAPDVSSIYDISINFEKEGLSNIICEVMGMKCTLPNEESKKWEKFAKLTHNHKKELNIAFINSLKDITIYCPYKL